MHQFKKPLPRSLSRAGRRPRRARSRRGAPSLASRRRKLARSPRCFPTGATFPVLMSGGIVVHPCATEPASPYMFKPPTYTMGNNFK